jgi:TRAP-type mannitol/chloroaromatic compound transport system permease small subunit
VNALLKLSRAIDAFSEWLGRHLMWLVLIVTLISATNAIVRKAFDRSSNGFLEIQWYLFAAIFLLAAGYTLLRNEHVKIDVVLGRFSKRTQIMVEIFGLIVFLFPFVYAVIHEAMPLVIKAYNSGEMSENAGGLIRWPVYALLPLGFAFLGLQGVSEIIKRVAFLQGLIDDPTKKKQQKTAEEELMEEIKAREGRELAERLKLAQTGAAS